MNLTPELAKVRDEIRGYATGYGLDFFDVIFEIVDWKEMNAIASYGGFPNRYPHWRFGMEFEQLSKSYEYGLSKIYEMVINTDPSYAYLLYSNGLVDQKLVMAHVYGHVDFFKNNVYFAPTDRKMMDRMGTHRTKVQNYMNRYGADLVESFIDKCLSLENLIDVHQTAIRRQPLPNSRVDEDASDAERLVVQKLKSKEYMDSFINPPEFLEDQRKKMEEDLKKEKKFPEHPERDVLRFLLHYAPLENWQQDVLNIIRDEACYFTPQAQTKIMNEGWASYWHSTIMTTRALQASEVVDYADHHSGTMATSGGRLNPYKLGIELLRDIEERWNMGRFGKEWEDCTDIREKISWDKKLGLGRQKIFEVRKLYNDLTFLDTFLTPEFCIKQKLFSFDYNKSQNTYEIVSREFPKIKDKLLRNLTNRGQPIIEVMDGNYNNRGELLLAHRHEGADLKPDYAEETLRNLSALWQRPVHIETLVDGLPKLLSFDGSEYKESRTA